TFVLTNDETGETFTSITNASGVYSFPNVPFGTYSLVEVPQPGYKGPCKAQTVYVDCTHTDVNAGQMANCFCEPGFVQYSMGSSGGVTCFQVVSTPPGVPGPLPRPVSLVTPHPLWCKPAVCGGEWLSASPTGSIDLPAGDYVYECCFCLSDQFS